MIKKSKMSIKCLPKSYCDWMLWVLVLVTFQLSQVHSEGKLTFGRCPQPGMDTRLCTGQTDQCTHDTDCGDAAMCCSTGCNKVCMLPVFTACEQLREETKRRSKSLEEEEMDITRINVPKCDDETGNFQQIQCSKDHGCHCVDIFSGYEKPGTRAKSIELVNCSRPLKKCDGPMCRMLCPYGFELDDDGCQVCECKDPCKGITCPKNTICQLEQIACDSTHSCPPIPSCKAPRSLDSVCPLGPPFIIPESGKPFLCGLAPGQPTCPTGFDCNVQPGGDYGICCATMELMEKPGTCPVTYETSDNEKDCSLHKCTTDLECPQFEKCCMTSVCGKRCSQPANSTICLQQRKIAELLSLKESGDKGYIPQCDEAGLFLPRQCSRNGKICWCVTNEGKSYPRSIGRSEKVDCSEYMEDQELPSFSSSSSSLMVEENPDENTKKRSGCDNVMCFNICEFGYKIDQSGCRTCECVESPCDTFIKCPIGSKCTMINDPTCYSQNINDCPLKPTCLSDQLFVNPCPLGTPLTHVQTRQVITCSEYATTCPSTHICVIVNVNKAGLCCSNRPKVEPTKPGMCPFLSPTLCNTTLLGVDAMQCQADHDCENSMKCCASGDCTICADPLLQQDVETQENEMTLCDYLMGSPDIVQRGEISFHRATHKPLCKDNGHFSPVQCGKDYCVCVDSYGVEINETLIDKRKSTLNDEYCLEKRRNDHCLNTMCRLDCEYGFEYLDGCPICECHNPCKNSRLCSQDEQCEMVDMDCPTGTCPPLPYCIPKLMLEESAETSLKETLCPVGEPYKSYDTNNTLFCNPKETDLSVQCPENYYCHGISLEKSLGLCCHIYEDDLSLLEPELDLINTNAIIVDGSNHILQTWPTNDITARADNSLMKPGQCPYLVPINGGEGGYTCINECENDSHCPLDSKCCVNSCGGYQCTRPLLLTACQHQKMITEHRIRESGMPAMKFFIPQCDIHGHFNSIQNFHHQQWCVDSNGYEIQGTRTNNTNPINCKSPRNCDTEKCENECKFGYELNPSGCPSCKCKKHECEDILCSDNEECRMIQLNCISSPCPPVPLCLPRIENPCLVGQPLTYEGRTDKINCGPNGTFCPSTHKCSMSPFGEFAVCCPKTKEACFQRQEIGICKAAFTKWYFNTSSNQCEEYMYSGCGATTENIFDTKQDCSTVCPALSSCERMRQKNQRLMAEYHHVNYIPKCEAKTGAWKSVQCFDHITMCWCVNQKGEPIKGTMTPGIPECRHRNGRKFNLFPSFDASSTTANDVTTSKSSKDETAENIAEIIAQMISNPVYNEDTTLNDYFDLIPTSSELSDYEEILVPPLRQSRMMTQTRETTTYQQHQSPTRTTQLVQGRSNRALSFINPHDIDLLQHSYQPQVYVTLTTTSSAISPPQQPPQIPTKKYGECPQISGLAYLNVLSGLCPDECAHDHHCQGESKCCLSECGLKCTNPISTASHQPTILIPVTEYQTQGTYGITKNENHSPRSSPEGTGESESGESSIESEILSIISSLPSFRVKERIDEEDKEESEEVAQPSATMSIVDNVQEIVDDMEKLLEATSSYSTFKPDVNISVDEDGKNINVTKESVPISTQTTVASTTEGDKGIVVLSEKLPEQTEVTVEGVKDEEKVTEESGNEPTIDVFLFKNEDDGKKDDLEKETLVAASTPLENDDENIKTVDDLRMKRLDESPIKEILENEIFINENSNMGAMFYATSENPGDNVSSKSLLEENYSHNVVVILLTIVAVVTACLAALGLFLALQKKKSTGTYPKKPFDTLAFNSQLYEIDSKKLCKGKESVSFKVTPYIANYREDVK